MKKTNKLLSLILAGTMLASSAAFTVDAKEEKPVANYSVDFVYNMNRGKATATISVTGGRFGVGRYAFSYNADLLTLVDSDGNPVDTATKSMEEIVIGSEFTDYNRDGEADYTVITTEETNLLENLIYIDTDAEGKKVGNVLFAWYTRYEPGPDGKDIGFIDAGEISKTVATLNFTFEVENKTPEELKETKEALSSGGALNRYQGDTNSNDGWNEEDIPDVFDEVFDATDDIEDDDGGSGGTQTPDYSIQFNVDVSGNSNPPSLTIDWSNNNLPNVQIDKYDVEITDDKGNVIYNSSVGDDVSKITVTSNDLNSGNIEVGKTYNVSVTPSFADPRYSVKGNIDSCSIRKPSSGSGSGNVSFTGGGTSSVTYTVTFQAGEGTIPEGQKFKYNVALNGSVSGSPAVVAPEGKVFAGWSVDGVTLVSVEIYKIKKNTVFKAIYVDNEAYTHRPFILGYPGGEVKADAPLTRAEAAAIIARASADFDSTKTYTANFSDVPADHWAANYIAFVYEKKIVTGYEDNSFHPSSNIKRSEFATIMQRYLGIELNEDASFVDVTKDHWAVAYIGACKDAGLINGYENGEFRPENEITRAEAVKILNRAADRAPTPASIDKYIAEKGVPFTDLDSAKWYFYEILEAAFPHLITYYH